MERGTCFACGMDGAERAHILARVEGGSDDLENLHILCGVCHQDSECLSGDRYTNWIMQRTALDRLMSQGMRLGINPSEFLQFK